MLSGWTHATPPLSARETIINKNPFELIVSVDILNWDASNFEKILEVLTLQNLKSSDKSE
jgi:hypothetical protein